MEFSQNRSLTCAVNLRNLRKTGAVSSAPGGEPRTSFVVWRRAATAFALLWFVQIGASSSLGPDELTLLQDPGGWEYISISAPDAGVQTTHTCFDGVPHPDRCSGTLMLGSDNTFVKNIHLQGGTDQRHGTYQLDGSQISFVDELGEKDGPFDLALNVKAKSLVLQMQGLRMELQLEMPIAKA